MTDKLSHNEVESALIDAKEDTDAGSDWLSDYSGTACVPNEDGECESCQ